MKHFHTATLAGILAILAGLGGCSVTPTMNRPTAMSARLSAASAGPPVASDGSGTVDAILNRQTNVLSWTITYAGLSGPVTAGHFDGPAITDGHAGVVLPVTGGLSSPIRGTAKLTAPQAADLTAGKWTLILRTAAKPEGEVRGQVTVPPCVLNPPLNLGAANDSGPALPLWWLAVNIDLQSPMSDGCYEMRLLAGAGPGET